MITAQASWGGVDTWMLVGILLLLLLSVVLSVAETTLTQISPVKAMALVEEGRSGADRLQRVIQDPTRYLNSVLLVVLVFQIGQSTLVGVLADRHLGAWGIAAATLLNIVVVFVVAEAAPKTWSLQHPEQAALASAPLVAMIGAFPPVHYAATALIGLTNVILPGKGLTQGPWVSEEEILALAQAAVAGSVIEDEERDLIESIIDFGDTVAREIMIPRTDMVAMQSDFAVSDMLEVAILNGLSRFPVYREHLDDVIGIVLTKDLVRAEHDGGGAGSVEALARDPFFVPETKRVAELLREMQARSTHMAVVIDEYGGTAGLVTLEDLIEELVGEISDETDRTKRSVEVEESGDIVVHDPSLNLDDLNDSHDLVLPEGDWDSVGGLVFARLGRVPQVGDVVPTERATLTVEKMDGRRIAQIRIAAVEPAGDDDAENRDRDSRD